MITGQRLEAENRMLEAENAELRVQIHVHVGERDRARRVAVALEQELAEVEAELAAARAGRRYARIRILRRRDQATSPAGDPR